MAHRQLRPKQLTLLACHGQHLNPDTRRFANLLLSVERHRPGDGRPAQERNDGRLRLTIEPSVVREIPRFVPVVVGGTGHFGAAHVS
jgi:hypothetical protein